MQPKEFVVLSLFKKKPPLTPSRRARIQLGLRSVASQMGQQEVANRQMYTSLESLCDGLPSSRDDIRDLYRRLADITGINANEIELDFLPGKSPQGQRITYSADPPLITVYDAAVTSPDGLILRLLLMLAEHKVQKDPSLLAGGSDAAVVRELWVATMGFGVLLATDGEVQKECCSGGSCETTPTARLNAIDVGYALAILARIRGESQPQWADYLRADADKTYRLAQKTMEPAGTMLIDADTIPDASAGSARLLDFIRHNDPTFQFAAVRQISQCDGDRQGYVDLLIPMLSTGDEDMIEEIVGVLETMGSSAGSAKHQLEILLEHGSDPIAIAAAKALMEVDSSEFLYENVGRLLEDRWNVAIPLADALAQKQHEAAGAAPHVCLRLVSAMRRTEETTIDSLMACLHSIHPEPAQVLKDTIDDEELLAWATEYLMHREQQDAIEPIPMPEV